MAHPSKILILSDHRLGHLNQCVGVAEALGISYDILYVQPSSSKRPISSFFKIVQKKNEVLSQLDLLGEGVLLMAAGNFPQKIMQAVKKARPDVFTVLMMRPYGCFGIKMNPKHWHRFFDVVVLPKHDAIHYKHLPENVVQVIGAPNRVNVQALTEAKLRWQKELNVVGDKKLAVLVGGKSKRFNFTESDASVLAEDVLHFAKSHNMGLLVTTSRRTGEAQEEILRKAFTQSNVKTFFWDGQSDNPIMGYFALADAFVVTAESTSMLSEASSTGKPVYVFGLNEEMQRQGMGKFNDFYSYLSHAGRIFPLSTASILEPEVEPLQDAAAVAAFIKQC